MADTSMWFLVSAPGAIVEADRDGAQALRKRFHWTLRLLRAVVYDEPLPVVTRFTLSIAVLLCVAGTTCWLRDTCLDDCVGQLISRFEKGGGTERE